MGADHPLEIVTILDGEKHKRRKSIIRPKRRIAASPSGKEVDLGRVILSRKHSEVGNRVYPDVPQALLD